MKTLITLITLIIISLTGGKDNTSANMTAEKTIAHEQFSTPASFGFGKNFYLDVDKDGMKDFMFTTVYTNEGSDIHTKYVVNALNQNEILTVDNNTAVEESGNDVKEFGNITWKTGITELIEQVDNGKSHSWNGVWSGDRDQYLGIKLVKDGKSYNGWVKVSIDQQNEQAMVDGYAVNRQANAPIAAGQI
jgi:hypothetical protein